LFIINIILEVEGINCDVIVWLNHNEIDFNPNFIYILILNDKGYVINRLNIIVVIISHLNGFGKNNICSGNDNQEIDDPDRIIVVLITIIVI